MITKSLQTFLILFFLSFSGVRSAHAFVDNLVSAGETFLDGVEEIAERTGLPALRRKLAEDYGFFIKPFLKLGYDYTTNVFLAPDDDSDHSDNIWSITPGFQWNWKSPFGAVGGAYEATFRYFTQFADAQNEQDQKLLTYANMFPTENTYIRLSHKLQQEGATAGSSEFKPVNYTDNTAIGVVGYNAGIYTFEFGYENFDRDFSNTSAKRFNYNEDKFDYRVYRKLNENIRIYTGLRLGQVDFYKDPTRDTFYYEIPAGFEGTLPSGIQLLASVGFHRRNLENSSRNDLSLVTTNISAEKSFNANRTLFSLGFVRRPVESTFANTTTYDEKLWYASLKHLFTPKLRGRLSGYVGNRDFEERTFTGNRVLVGGVLTVVPPTQVKRDDDIVGVTVGMDYALRRWLVLQADYSYARRNSNISALDYTENSISLRTTVPL